MSHLCMHGRLSLFSRSNLKLTTTTTKKLSWIIGVFPTTNNFPCIDTSRENGKTKCSLWYCEWDFSPDRKKVWTIFFAIDFQWDTVVVRWLAGMWDWQQSVFSTFSPTGNAFLSQQVKNLPTSRNNNHPMGQQQLGVQRSVFMWGLVFLCFSALLKKTFFHRAKRSWIDFSYTSTKWWNANGA